MLCTLNKGNYKANGAEEAISAKARAAARLRLPNSRTSALSGGDKQTIADSKSLLFVHHKNVLDKM